MAPAKGIHAPPGTCSSFLFFYFYTSPYVSFDPINNHEIGSDNSDMKENLDFYILKKASMVETSNSD